MQPCGPYLYEFLYRGRAPGDETAPAWHVQIETRLDAGGDRVVPHVRTLNVAQATKEGWDLKKIGAAINTDALAELEQLREEVALLKGDLEELERVHQSVKNDRESLHMQNLKLREALTDRAAAADRATQERDQAHADIRRLAAVVDEQTAVVKQLQKKQPRPAPARRSARRPNA